MLSSPPSEPCVRVDRLAPPELTAMTYAVEKTRTSTGLPPQAPQACASTIPPRPPGQAAGYTGCATPLQLPPVRRKQGFRIEEVLGPRSTMGLSDEHGIPMDHRANPLASATGGACPRALDQAVDPEAGKGGCFHLLHPLPVPPPLRGRGSFGISAAWTVLRLVAWQNRTAVVSGNRPPC